MEEQTKNRLKDMDETVLTVQKSLDSLNDFIEKTKVTGQLMHAKLKREKLRSLAAIAQYQAMIVDLEMLITQNELKLKLFQIKTGKPVYPSNNAVTAWSAPAHAAAMSENNDWLASKLRDVAAEEEQFNRMLEDGSSAGAAPLQRGTLCREQRDVINGLYKELMEVKSVKLEPTSDAEDEAHSNASADTLILCAKCDAAEKKHVCPV